MKVAATNYNTKDRQRIFGGRASIKAVEVLVRREWLKVFKEPSRAVGIIIQPLLFWWVIGSGFVPTFHAPDAASINYQTYFFPGIFALILLFSSIFSMITLIDDRNSGFMQAVLVAPCSRLSIVFGKIIGAFSIACTQALLFLLLMPLAHISAADVFWSMFLAFAVFGALFFTALGFLMAWLSPSTSAFHALMSIVLLPMWILSGAMFPLQNTWMAPISELNPAAWLVHGFHFTLLGSQLGLDSWQVFSAVYASFLKLFLFSVITTCAGVYVCYRNR